MSRSIEAIRDAWPERLFLPPAPVMRGFALVEYGDRRVQLPASIADRYPVLFEDDDLIVFDLAAHRASDLGRRARGRSDGGRVLEHDHAAPPRASRVGPLRRPTSA